MSQNLHELCCLIIEDFYGAFYALIFSHLLSSGRSNAGQIAQKAHLPLRQVKAGLATLVQCRLICHHTSGELTTYQADLASTYNVLRSGKLAELARNQYGNTAGAIISEACILGFSTIAELISCVVTRLAEANCEHVNGTAAETIQAPTSDEILDAVDLLIDNGYLVNVRAAQFQADYDATRDAETSLGHLGTASLPKGRKGQQELELRIERAKRDRQSLRFTEHGHIPHNTRKHAMVGEEDSQAKRRKPDIAWTPGQVNGELTNHTSYSSSVLVSVSYRNLVRDIRDRCITEATKRALGERQSRVMKTALVQVLTSERWISDVTGSSLNIEKLQDDLSYPPTSNGKVSAGANGHVKHSNGDHHYPHSHAELERSLKLFCESGFHFIENLGDHDNWAIDKTLLDLYVQEREILRLIEDRLGSSALRIIRMLSQKGKLDEKTLQETGLLGAKELRQILASLKQKGFIDLQEVPREAQRQPNRTIFLWFHEPERVRKVLLENLYKAMSRLMQRLQIERLKVSSTLEKVERSDVQGSEDQMLSAGELKVLKRFQKTEGWMLGEIARLDQSVAILRDL